MRESCNLSAIMIDNLSFRFLALIILQPDNEMLQYGNA